MTASSRQHVSPLVCLRFRLQPFTRTARAPSTPRSSVRLRQALQRWVSCRLNRTTTRSGCWICESQVTAFPGSGWTCRAVPVPERLASETEPRWTPCCTGRSEEHTSELQSHLNLVCRLLL